LTTQPEMHCQNCEKKIKNNIRFEKGIKTIKTNLEKKTVTIEYDADKTNVQNIIAGFEKINYKATEVKEEKNSYCPRPANHTSGGWASLAENYSVSNAHVWKYRKENLL